MCLWTRLIQKTQVKSVKGARCKGRLAPGELDALCAEHEDGAGDVNYAQALFSSEASKPPVDDGRRRGPRAALSDDDNASVASDRSGVKGSLWKRTKDAAFTASNSVLISTFELDNVRFIGKWIYETPTKSGRYISRGTHWSLCVIWKQRAFCETCALFNSRTARWKSLHRIYIYIPIYSIFTL